MRRIFILAIIGLASGTASALAGEGPWNDLMRGAGIVVDHQPLNTGGFSSDTEFELFGDPFWQRVADDFLMPEAVQIQRIQWWGFYDEDNAPTSEQFRIRVYGARESDQLPDESQVFLDATVINPARSATGRQIAVGIAPHEYFYRAEPPQATLLPGGTMLWLEILQLGDVTTRFRWEFSAAESNGQAFMNPVSVDWELTPQPYADTAFQLVVVPEPSSLLLAVSVLTYLAFRPRRLKRGV